MTATILIAAGCLASLGIGWFHGRRHERELRGKARHL